MFTAERPANGRKVTPANPSGLRLPNPSGHLDDEYLQEDLPVVSFAESPADMANVR
jgi:hypothetical protein